MGTPESLDLILGRIACGHSELLPEALSALGPYKLFVPAVNLSDQGDDRNSTAISVGTEIEGERRLVMAFTSEDQLFEWAETECQSLPVAGADLALSLPPSFWMVINPRSENRLELSPDQLKSIIEQDQSFIYADEEHPEVASEPTKTVASGLAEAAVTALAPLLERYPEIREGYLKETESAKEQRALLGLVVEDLGSSRRFCLIEEVAELSRCVYGVAGAIAVLDAADFSTEPLKGTFTEVTPFYLRATPRRSPELEKLSWQIEVTRERPPSLAERFFRRGKERFGKTLWRSQRNE